MAEALGTAASVIAVIDLAGKAVTLTFKLKCLWDEVKDVPAALLEKAEELQLLDEILRDDEIHAANNPLPAPAWNDAIMQKAMGRARAAMEDLQMTLDAHNRSLEDKRRHRRKLTAARVVLHKESLLAMERKLDNALRLYRMAESRYIFKTCASINAQRLLPPLQASVTVETQSDNLSNSGDDTFESLRRSKSYLTKHSKPDFTAISKGTAILGRLLFGLGYQSCHISIRTPNWLGNTVYSVMAQQSVSGWQLNSISYAVVHDIPHNVLDAVKNDDIVDLQRRLREAKLTPYVHEQDGWNLLTTFDCVLQSAIKSWVTILYANGVNLLEYGYKESCSAFYHREGRIPRRDQEAGHRYTYFRVVGITYGALPEQWKVWWSVYGLEYAGDFWRMVENPVVSIPGGWKDDFDSPGKVREEELVPWDDEEMEYWIGWSEYRKIRPPC
ncbi:hypothetical protein CGCVW01_v006573 [Colletotrichum viniferum]|nr:hypothetical protein CGCVW01_v006573 [Colletotrichum viniferum]